MSRPSETDEAKVSDEANGVVVDMLDPEGKVRCPKCTVKAARYLTGGDVALTATCEDGEPWDVLTVNLPGVSIPRDCVAVRDYSEGAGNLRTLADAGLVESRPVRVVRSGFVAVPVCRLTKKGVALVKAYDDRHGEAKKEENNG
jgi:hypothetical protein